MSSQLNSIQLISSHLNLTQFISTQLNSSQLNSIHLNSTQFISTHLNLALNSTQLISTSTSLDSPHPISSHPISHLHINGFARLTQGQQATQKELLIQFVFLGQESGNLTGKHDTYIHYHTIFQSFPSFFD